MKWENLNAGWYFKRGTIMTMKAMGTKDFGEKVNLPHDYMISSDVKEDAPGTATMGYYAEGAATYTKFLNIPKEWEGEKIYLYFDGAMMNASVFVNGGLCRKHHYGYTPFTVDLTDQIYYGEENRISVVVSPNLQPDSRWYTGAGLYRDVFLAHTAAIHVAADGIFSYTKQLYDVKEDVAGSALLMHEITVENHSLQDHQVKAAVSLIDEKGNEVLTRESVVFVEADASAAARVTMTVSDVQLWDVDHPYCYRVKAVITDMGSFGVHLKNDALDAVCDTAETLFGIRTIAADAVRGLQINGKTVKIKGGCIHHDNGMLGAVSLYDSEYRKVKKLKDAGYNGIRTAHNPPSSVLLKVSDKLGMYVFDEAFDAWGFAKVPGDYSLFFEECWKEDMRAFMTRDRSHPSVIFWSTGNEVEERGGLGNGYAKAEELAAYARTLDPTRLISNGLCSMWNGLDDKGVVKQIQQMKASMGGQAQNLDTGKEDTSWEERTEAFANCLDVVGYNYLDSHYEYDHERYPERVILGTESYPAHMAQVWEMVQKMPYVIGDFTWTAYDYIGEAGIGKTAFFEKDDPRLKMGAWLMSSHASEYPWRLANDADFTINGMLTPQGICRKIMWGSEETGLFTQHPDHFELEEVTSSWGWKEMSPSWNYLGAEGKKVKTYVYTAADEAELILNGVSLGKKAAGKENHYLAVFEVPFEKGKLEAVSIREGQVVSRSCLVTTEVPVCIDLEAERTILEANGRDLAYIAVKLVDKNGNLVPDAQIRLEAVLEGGEPENCRAHLAGFGSDNPCTTDNYTSGNCTSYKGQAMAIVRADDEAGDVVLRVTGEDIEGAEVTIHIV